MNIRLTNKFDLPYFLHLVHNIHKQGEIGYYDVDLDDTYLNTLFNTILHGGGIGLIIEEDDKPIGMTLGLINPNIWSHKTLVCHQILLFIDEEYRNTRAGHMLISEYNEQCQELVDTNRIQYFTLSAAKPLFDIDFTRFGYECVEKTWLNDGA
jgi:GNAT superfamily N-acetyltransferase